MVTKYQSIIISSMLVLSSCVSVLPSSDQAKIFSPVDVGQIQVSVEESSDIGLTQSKFFDEGIFRKSENAPEIHLTYKECAATFDEGALKRSLNILLPFITLGFVPHKMKYTCPLVVESIKDKNTRNKFSYDIIVETSASIYELFKSKAPVESQLNDERFRATKKIIQEHSPQIVGKK